MTQEELDKIIETDLFQMRGFAIRYIDYGKELASNASAIFSDLDKIDTEIKEMQGKVEAGEKQALEAIKSANQDKPELMIEVDKLIRDVDKAHTDILVIKHAMIDGIKAKYGL